MSTLVFRPYSLVRPTRPADARVQWPTAPAAPAVALERDEADGVLVVEAPGLDPATDLAVRVVGDRLTVAGKRRQVTGPVRRESRFSRSVVLPEGVGPDAVTARYEAGVLRVRVAGLFPTPVEPVTHDIAIASDVVPSVSDGEQEQQQSEEQAPERTEA